MTNLVFFWIFYRIAYRSQVFHRTIKDLFFSANLSGNCKYDFFSRSHEKKTFLHHCHYHRCSIPFYNSYEKSSIIITFTKKLAFPFWENLIVPYFLTGSPIIRGLLSDKSLIHTGKIGLKFPCVWLGTCSIPDWL